MRRIATPLVTVALLAMASSAAAQTANSPPAVTPQQESEARAHFERGLALFNAQDYNGALAEFQAAYDLSHRPTVLYNLGVAQQALHHYPEAARAIEQYLREASITPERRHQVEQGLDEIRQFIAHVTLSGLPNGSTVTIDGDPVPASQLGTSIAVGTGRHVIAARAPGYEASEQSVLIAGGQQRDVRFALQPIVTARAPAPAAAGLLDVRGAPAHAVIEIDDHRVSVPIMNVPPGTHRVRVSADGYVAWQGSVDVPAAGHRITTVHLARSGRFGPAPFAIVGGATLLFGAATLITGVLTLDTHSQFETRTQESPDVQSLASQGALERTLTNVFLGVTCVGAVATVYLLTRTSFDGAQSRVDIAIAPRLEGGGEAAVRVRF